MVLFVIFRIVQEHHDAIGAATRCLSSIRPRSGRN